MTPSPLLGCAVADALGKPFETKPASEIIWDGRSMQRGSQPESYGPRVQDPGVSTDDTQMSRILGRTLVQMKGRYVPDFVAGKYLEWHQGKSFVGKPRGMGGTILKALTRLDKGVPFFSAGEVLPADKPCGCGTTMRAGVLGTMRGGIDSVALAAEEDAVLTHKHLDAVAGSIAMAAAVWNCLEESEENFTEDLLKTVRWVLGTRGYSEFGGRVTDMSSVISSDGDAFSMTRSALVIAATATSYEGGVVRAIRLGNDTDTRGAMVGVILGTRFGLEGIPPEWIGILDEAKDIMEEDRELVDLARDGR